MQGSNTIGIIIFRRESQAIKYLLLHHGSEYWNFPKGRQEEGEDELQTALRELKEETGITDVKIMKDYRGEYDYDFDTEIKDGVKERVFRHALFFIGEVASDEVVISDEHVDHGWFDFETASKRLFYQNGQDLLKNAHQYLFKNSNIMI